MYGTAGLVRDRREMVLKRQQQQLRQQQHVRSPAVFQTSSKPEKAQQQPLRTLKFGLLSIHY
eukprot:scaffold200_cov173-Amphora_coffeaeformis.AAC.9